MSELICDKKYIIAATRDGLGNRLKCLISAMRMAERYSKPLILFWPVDEKCSCKFSDLFENKIPEVDSKGPQTFTKDEKYKIIETWRFLLLLEDELPDNFSRKYPSYRGKDIDLEYDRIPLPLRKDFLTYVNKLIPKKYIVEEAENFSKKFNDNTISVNIRSWCYEGVDESWRKGLFDIKKIYKFLDKIENRNFFVAYDNPEILEKLVNRYGKRILFYPENRFNKKRNSEAGIKNALVELLLLSKNKDLKVSFLSTFSEMAWWFGGCRANVEVIPTKAYLFKKVSLYEAVGYSLFWKWYIQPSKYSTIQRLALFIKQFIEG